MTNQTLNNQVTASFYASCSIEAMLQQVDSLIKNSYLKQSVASKEQNIGFEAVNYHFNSSGQKVRAKLCLDACIKLAIPYDDMLILAATSELLHNASLIHDDIQDADEIRRGQPTVWKKYGINIAICAGDLLLSAAYGVLAAFGKTSLLPQLIFTINNQTMSAIEGQSLDIFFNNKPALSIEQYANIAIQKSGALLSLPIELALIAAQRNESIEIAKKACANFAIGYQIADDLEDVIRDSGYNSINQSVNIIFVLKELGVKNVHQKAASMCHQSLDDARYYAQQLPNNSGSFLIGIAEKLKAKIAC